MKTHSRLSIALSKEVCLPRLRTLFLVPVFGIALSICTQQTQAGEIAVVNGSFEDPPLEGEGWANFPKGYGWEGFDLGIYVAKDGGAFEVKDAIPDGVQAKGLTTGGDFSQSIEFPEVGEYTITFYVGGRGSEGALGAASYQVSISGNTFYEGKTRTGQAFEQIEAKFTVSQVGSHDIQFKSTDEPGTDRTAFIDAIKIVK